MKLGVVLAILLILPVVSADVSVSSTGTCAVAPATYSLEVTNDGGFADTYRIRSLGTYKTWLTFEEDDIRIQNGRTETFVVVSHPPSNTPPGTYNVPIRIYAETNADFSHAEDICVFVKDVREVSFTTVNVDDFELTPGEDLEIELFLKNTGTEGFKAVTLTYDIVGSSDLFILDREFDISKGEKIDFTERLPITPQINPGDYTVFMQISKDDNILGSHQFTFNVPKVENVEITPRELWTPFANFNRITLENNGNVHSSDSISYSVRRPFNALVTAEGDYRTEENGNELTYVWDASLAPGESLVVKYRFNYWPILLGLLLLIYGGYRAFFTMRRPTVRKVLLNSRRLNDHMQEFTVALEIKNKTPKDIKRLEVREFVPHIAKVVKDFGSLKPKTKVNNGTELVWTIKDFKRDDNRMIRYRIVTTVGAVDQFKLPKAVITGSIGGSKFRIHSNELRVGSDRNE